MSSLPFHLTEEEIGLKNFPRPYWSGEIVSGLSPFYLLFTNDVEWFYAIFLSIFARNNNEIHLAINKRSRSF